MTEKDCLIYKENQTVPFEGHQFDAMGNADGYGYLRCVYGDYKIPPPPDQRYPIHFTKGDIYVKNFYDAPS